MTNTAAPPPTMAADGIDIANIDGNWLEKDR
jgi:hypothetical protein